MPEFPYVIIGGGMAAASAVQGIREADSTGAVAVLAAEPDQPYKRPPLSKNLWQGKPLNSIWMLPPDLTFNFYPNCTASSINPAGKTVTTQDGQVFQYGKLLLATGSSPRRLPFGGDDILYYRTLNDYRLLRKRAEERHRFAIIGGGFIGSELAASLCMNDCEVALIFPENGISDRVMPPEIAEYLVDYYRSKGVEVYPGEMVNAVNDLDGRRVIRTRSGKEILADTVVAGIGVEPNTKLAAAAGIDVDNGIIVNERLQTSQPDIYAAGDVANFYNSLLDQRLRIEHADNATSMGRMVGQIMAGKDVQYDYLPFFYSDLFDIGYEAVGELDSRLETVFDWKEPFAKGVIYYLKENLVRGVLLWNVWDQVPAAREIIGNKQGFQKSELIGKI